MNLAKWLAAVYCLSLIAIIVALAIVGMTMAC